MVLFFPFLFIFFFLSFGFSFLSTACFFFFFFVTLGVFLFFKENTCARGLPTRYKRWLPVPHPPGPAGGGQGGPLAVCGCFPGVGTGGTGRARGGGVCTAAPWREAAQEREPGQITTKSRGPPHPEDGDDAQKGAGDAGERDGGPGRGEGPAGLASSCRRRNTLAGGSRGAPPSAPPPALTP